MKFFIPKTLPGSVMPMILMNWFFGIGVIEYPIGKPRRIISMIWSIVNFIFYVGILKLGDVASVSQLRGSKIAAKSYRINTYCGMVFLATSLCLAKIRSKVVRNTIFKLGRTNNKLNILGIPNDYEFFFIVQIVQIAVPLTGIFIMFFLGLKYFGFDFPTEISRLCFLISGNYFLTFAFVVDLTFNVSIRYVGNRFRRLNALLAELDSAAEVRKTKANQIPYYDPLAIDEIHRCNSQCMRDTDQRWLLYVIRETRKLHRSLCKTAMELNRAFSIQILFSVTISFAIIVLYLYTLYVALTRPGSRSTNIRNWMPKIIMSIRVIFYAAKIILIVDTCETTSCEANRTRKFICKLLDTVPCDEDIRDEINFFSLQLIQNPLYFTACGFFTLNYPLIRGIIGSTTTYLIIMIQMRNMYEPEIYVNPTANSSIQTNGTV